MPQLGPYTIKDNQERKDRTELIDGNIYPMKLYFPLYATWLRELYFCIRNYLKEHHPEIRAFEFVGVQLDRDEATLIVPDIAIVKDPEKLANGTFVYGAPEMVVEMLANDPEDRERDLYLKLPKYASAGVRQYWILDPEHKQLAVYDFSRAQLPHVYSFEETVAVPVIDPEFTIDFKAMSQKVDKYFEVQKITRRLMEQKGRSLPPQQ